MFRKFSELWPGGPQGLIEELRSAGFKIDAPPPSSLNQMAWELLGRPRSAHANAISGEFAYLSKDAQWPTSKNWAFLLVEAGREIPPGISFPCLSISAADAAFDFILQKISPPEWFGLSAAIPTGVHADGHVVIGPDCEIGAGTILETGVRIGARVKIGTNCRIGAHSRISDGTEIGNDCYFTASVSVGGPGFGFVRYPGAARTPRMHVGRVRIGDRVRLGAFVAIDRGVIEDTIVGSDTCIDNFVQVAHNCVIGTASTFCAFVGLSGSTTVGDRVTIAGMVGTKGHVDIGNDVTVAGQSGVSRDIGPGQTVKGYPPKPLAEALKIQALVDKLPDLYARLKILERSANLPASAKKSED